MILWWFCVHLKLNTLEPEVVKGLVWKRRFRLWTSTFSSFTGYISQMILSPTLPMFFLFFCGQYCLNCSLIGPSKKTDIWYIFVDWMCLSSSCHLLQSLGIFFGERCWSCGKFRTNAAVNLPQWRPDLHRFTSPCWKMYPGWWFQPISKICSSNWILSPGRGENKKCLKPPPSISWQRNGFGVAALNLLGRYAARKNINILMILDGWNPAARGMHKAW